MKCICLRKCQAVLGDAIVLFSAGQVVEFEECPRNFESLADKEIDFKTAEREELLDGDYDLSELKAYIEETFGKKAGNKGKEKTVALLLDCRYRAVDLNDVI